MLGAMEQLERLRANAHEVRQWAMAEMSKHQADGSLESSLQWSESPLISMQQQAHPDLVSRSAPMLSYHTPSLQAPRPPPYAEPVSVCCVPLPLPLPPFSLPPLCECMLQGPDGCAGSNLGTIRRE